MDEIRKMIERMSRGRPGYPVPVEMRPKIERDPESKKVQEVGPPPVSDDDGSEPLSSGQFAPPSVGSGKGYEIIGKFRELMNSKRGLDIPDNPQLLGTGTRGSAYDIGGGRALKITGDRQEAEAANRLKRMRLKHVVKISDVFQFKKTALYGIVQERLQELSDAEKKELNDALVTTGFPVWLHHGNYNWDQAKQKVVGWLTKKAREISSIDERKSYLERANVAWTTLSSKYHIKEIVAELSSAGIKFRDYHAGNMMKRGSDYVLIDVGYSKVDGGEQLDVLERLVRESLVVEDLDKIGATGVVNTLKKNDSLLKKKKKIDTSQLKFLGHGQKGIAFKTKSGLVLKVTTDQHEAATSFYLIGKSTKKVVKIFDVFRLSSDAPIPVYGIVQELLVPLSDAEKEEFDTMATWATFKENIEVTATKGWTEVRKAVFDLILSETKKEMGLDTEDLGPKAKRANLVAQVHLSRWEKVARKYDFPAIIDELRQLQIEFADFHGGNLMKRGSEYVINDLGLSNSPGRLPPLLERLQSLSEDDDDWETRRTVFGFPADPSTDTGKYGQYTGDQILKVMKSSYPILKKNGIDVDVTSKLGLGAFGIAFKATYKGKSVAVKVTGEIDEAKASNHLKGKNFKHVCHVHEVFRLPRTPPGTQDPLSNNEGRPLYLIVMEILTPPSSEEKWEFGQMFDILMYVGGMEPVDLWERSFDDVSSLVQQGFEERERSNTGIFRTDNWSFDHFIDLAKKFQLKEMIADVTASKIEFRDVHEGNIMKRGPDFVLIDPGLAESPGTLPKMVEQIVRVLLSESKTDTVGVTIGDFQPFGKGHAELVRNVASRFDRVVIIVTKSDGGALSYDLRRDIIERSLPDIETKVEVFKAPDSASVDSVLLDSLADIARDQRSSIDVETAVNVVVDPAQADDIKRQIGLAVDRKGQGEQLLFDPGLVVVSTFDRGVDRSVSTDDFVSAVRGGEEDRVADMLDPHVLTNHATFKDLFFRMKEELSTNERSLKEDLEDVGEDGIDGLLRTNAVILMKSKRIDVKKLKKLGQGQMGIAYDAGNDRVLKVTTDHMEAQTSQYLIGKQSPHVVKIDDVFRFPTARSMPVFGIVQEKLTSLSRDEEREFDTLADWLRHDDVIDRTATGNWPDVQSSVRDLITKDIRQDLNLPPEPPAVTGIKNKLEHRAQQLIDSKYAQFVALSQKYNIDLIVAELRALRVQFADYHAGNMMKRGSDYVINDLGQSKSPGQEPPVLESRGPLEEDWREHRTLAFQNIIDVSRDKLSRRGVDASSIRTLGAGGNGTAFDLGDGRVLKVTEDSTEARASNHIKGKQGMHVVRVYDTFMFPKDISPQPLYGIVQEKLQQLNQEERGLFAQMESAFSAALRSPFRMYLRGKAWEEFRTNIEKHATNPSMAEQAFEIAAKIQIPEILDELFVLGVKFEDLHVDNVMKRGDDFVVIDLGVSQSPGALPPLLERDDSRILAAVEREREKISKLGVSVSDAIGKGSNGIAFDAGSGHVLKVTEDASEARAANHIKGKRTANLVRVSHVFRFPDEGSQGKALYGIVQERLQKLSDEEERRFLAMAFEDFWDIFGAPLGQVLGGKSWDEFENAARQAAGDDPGGSLVRALDAARSFQIPEMADELRSFGIVFKDWSAGNIMKRGSDFVLIDLGFSRSAGADPPILEGKKNDERSDLGFGFNESGYPLQDRYEFQGLKIAVENKKGSHRQWGKKPSEFTKMKYDYGYVIGHEGADGDEVDVYVGPDQDSEWVFVIHQMKNPKFKKFDEDKVMLGFSSEERAKKAYLDHYDDDRFYGGMSVMRFDDFKKKLRKKDSSKITNERFEIEKMATDVVESLVAPTGGALNIGLGSKHTGLRVGSSGWSSSTMSHDHDDLEGDRYWQRNLKALQAQSPRLVRKAALPKER